MSGRRDPGRDMKKTYLGFSQSTDGSGGAVVTITDGSGSRPLNPRFDLFNHSPTGFNWGYGGSGPAQLALALLADATGNDELALRLRHPFKFSVVARWPSGQPWSITEDVILAHARRIEAATKERTS
jgi:hypothetical protein